MGIHDLLPFLRKRASSAFTPIGFNLQRFRGQRTAIDVAIQLHRIIFILQTDSVAALSEWFLRTHSQFLKAEIAPIYVFDGAKLDAKNGEAIKRAKARSKAQERVDELRAEVASACEDYESSARLSAAAHALQIAESRTLKPSQSLFLAIEHALCSVGANCVTAQSEAEKHCAALSHNDEVDFVITNDSDTLPFGAKRVLFFFGSAKAELCELETVLAELKLSLDEFRHFCVLSGCDFCDRVPGIGIVKAYELVVKHRTIPALVAFDARFCVPVPSIASIDSDALDAAIADARDELDDLDTEEKTRREALVCQIERFAHERRALDVRTEQARGVHAFLTRYQIALDIFTIADA